MEICLEMLFRFVLAHNHPQPQDVPVHVHADVCLLVVFALSFHGGFRGSPVKCRRQRLEILSLRPFRSSYVASRNNINPHSHTFSIAYRVRR